MQYRILFVCLLWLTWCEATAQENEILNDSVRKLDEVIIKANTILGNKFVAKNRTGASYFLSRVEPADHRPHVHRFRNLETL